jgi:CDP-6-deoxy-D-xylo-4-hexulose-3-dehydrase
MLKAADVIQLSENQSLKLVLDTNENQTLVVNLSTNIDQYTEQFSEMLLKSDNFENSSLNGDIFADFSLQEKLQSNDYKVVATLNSATFDELLRNLTKYSSSLYYKNFKVPKKAKETGSEYIPSGGKVLDENELFGLIDASLDMWLTAGRFTKEFEKKFAKYFGVKYAITVNSGSSANLIALSTLTSHKLGDRRLRRGDEVITVAAGFPTTISPIVQNVLIPVFVDIDVPTYNVDVTQLETALTPKTKAVMIAHTLGMPYDLKGVKEFCEKHNLWLIEDNCDALGSKFDGKYTGTHGHIGTTSFYPAHHITMGEGGAVMLNDPLLYKIAMSMRDWGRDCWCPPGIWGTCNKRFEMKLGKLPVGYDHKYTYSHLGYNMKISDSHAVLGISQLDKLQSFVDLRQRNYRLLTEGLKKYEEHIILPEIIEGADPSWFGYLITLKDHVTVGNKFELCEELESKNIGTRQLFGGNILRQPLFADDDVEIRILDSGILKTNELTDEHYQMLPRSEQVMDKTFWVGLWPGITPEEITYVCDQIGEAILKRVATVTK